VASGGDLELMDLIDAQNYDGYVLDLIDAQNYNMCVDGATGI
jgi:hypothetical protein